MWILSGGGPATWTGSLPTWILVVIGLAFAWRITRGGGGTAVSELTAANAVLTHALQEQREITDKQAKEIAALQGKTDVVLAITPLMQSHEKNAQERHAATVKVLAEMSESLHKMSAAA